MIVGKALLPSFKAWLSRRHKLHVHLRCKTSLTDDGDTKEEGYGLS